MRQLTEALENGHKMSSFIPVLFFPCSTMYWADWGNHPKIETAAMDGTLRQTLVHENIQWPTGQCNIKFSSSLIPFATSVTPSTVSAGLAVDYFNERLYWADAKLSVIGSVRLDGSDPVISVSGIKNS